jgi:hypothetical protein
MKSIRIAAISILFLSSYTLAASQIAFTLGLQDSAGTPYTNYVANWKGTCDPTRFPTSDTTDNQTFAPNSILTWDVQAQVSGTHSNGSVPSGIANLVFNLELQRDSGGGNWVTVPFGAGSAIAAGWFSKINDGSTGTRQTTCGKGPDTPALAAATVGYTISGKNGRIMDLATDGGPYVDYFQYPSAAGFPTNSTAPTGKLLGCGAGYSKYHSVADTGGANTAGVGVASGSASCAASLGVGSVFEGQLNTKDLAAGTYRLVLTPGTGCNILDGSFNCLGADPGKFALKPDSASLGDSITFQIQAVVPPANITAWRSLKTHSGAGEFGITLNAAATATGSANGGIKVESRNSAGQNGITKIQVDFDTPVTVLDASQVTATGASTTGCNSAGANCVLGTTRTVAAASASMTSAQTMTVLFANSSLPGDACYTITIGAGAVSATIAGDNNCKVRMLQSDSNGDGVVNLIDASQVKSRNGQAVTAANCSSDQNLVQGINLIDATQAKSRNGKRALCP